jgi:hypothetical protein
VVCAGGNEWIRTGTWFFVFQHDLFVVAVPLFVPTTTLESLMGLVSLPLAFSVFPSFLFFSQLTYNYRSFIISTANPQNLPFYL